MDIWLIVITMIVLMAVLYWITRPTKEGFLTVDLPTTQAQRQMLQFEGERRYNDLARLQAPRTIVSPDDVAAALTQPIPVSTSHTASLLKFLPFSLGLGAADDGTNKVGQGVEQTGVVKEKIKFCESLLTTNCGKLDDPRLAECGLCLDGGKNSRGKPHRGGLYISSDDQIRANEVSNANGQAPAVYQPTVGSCPANNFVLMKTNCEARSAQLHCLKAGAPTSSNMCGQCYGGTPVSQMGLLFMGSKPVTYQAILNISHPGGHSNSGNGIFIQTPTGTVYSPPSSRPLFDPRQIPITITEGDTITITLYGAPAIWCGWLSNPSGTRTVSLDIGEQSISPALGFQIAGDKNSGPVTTAAAKADTDIGPAFLQSVPNTVLWYQRRDDAVPGMVTSAWYGVYYPPTSATNPAGVDVTGYIKAAAGANMDITVNLSAINIPDPAPGSPKYLWINKDNGTQVFGGDGQTITANQYYNAMTMVVTVPATLVDPVLSDDKANCPTGPMILTEIGSGLMSSHSCFTAKGDFNPTPYCLQELFMAAGGTQKGSAYPSSAAQATALVQKDPSTGKPSLDATTAYLNNQANIAIYGVDENGAQVDWTTFVAASQAMLGTTPLNPCDGPLSQTGPHSAECLDYLYRTSGNPGMDATQVDPATLPYDYCSPNGSVAPLNPDGSVNQSNVTTANSYGAVGNVRAYYQGVYESTQDSTNFDSQISAMQQCFGVNIQPPAETPSACPPPNPDDWQCFPPTQLLQPEVFLALPSGGGYSTLYADARGVCNALGAEVATKAQLVAAQQGGAAWCSAAWVADDTQNAYYPAQTNQPGCGSIGVNEYGGNWLPNSDGSTGNQQGQGNPAIAMANVNCYGVKPPPGTPNIGPFNNAGAWYSTQQPALGNVTMTAVPAFREADSGQVQCASADGKSCYMFSSPDACSAWTQNPSAGPSLAQVAVPTQGQQQFVDTYVRARV